MDGSLVPENGYWTIFWSKSVLPHLNSQHLVLVRFLILPSRLNPCILDKDPKIDLCLKPRLSRSGTMALSKNYFKKPLCHPLLMRRNVQCHFQCSMVIRSDPSLSPTDVNSVARHCFSKQMDAEGAIKQCPIFAKLKQIQLRLFPRRLILSNVKIGRGAFYPLGAIWAL